MKIPVIEKNAQEDTIWQYFKSSNTFYESRDVVAPLRKHRLCDNQKTAYWDSFESRSRIFILTKFDRFWRNSEICPIFQWPITFSPFGICLNDYGYLIVMFSAIYTWKMKTKALKLTKLRNFWWGTFFLCHPVTCQSKLKIW